MLLRFVMRRMPSHNTPSRFSRQLLLLVAGIVLAGLCSVPVASADQSGCTYVASPSGSDGAAGTVDAPFQTVNKLASALGPGQIGCLRAGRYDGNVKISQGGTATAPLTLRSYPGETATIRGRLWIANGADYTTIEYLNLAGVDQGNDCAPYACPSPTVNANHTSFIGNNVTDEHTAICFLIGSNNGYGRADYTLIKQNRIHDCGVLPAANHDHGIYLEATTGSTVVGNYIYDNADRGIQLYPNAHATVISGNVIAGNGEGIIFGADGSQTSSDNIVENNVIVNSKVRYNVEDHYGPNDAVGTGNIVRNNCVGGGARETSWSPGGVLPSAEGFSVDNNTIAAPTFVDPTAGDFRLTAGSACQGILTGTGPDGAFTVGSTTQSGGPAQTGSTQSAGTTQSAATPSASTTHRHRPRTRRFAVAIHRGARIGTAHVLRILGVLHAGSPQTAQAASPTRRFVAIRIHSSAGWSTTATRWMSGNRFSFPIRVDPRRSQRIVVSATVARVGRSNTLTIRIR